jgi:gluconolactonase
MAGSVQIYDDRLRSLIDPEATLKHLSDEAVWGEGPVYIPADDSVIWSDAHGNRLLRWHPGEGSTVLRQPSDYQNGNALDQEGRIISCCSGLRAIIRQEHDGHWHILVNLYQNQRLNSPNDLVVKRDGTIWFTDPPYGITQPDQGYGGAQEQNGCYVYRFVPKTGEIHPVVTDMPRPNGLAFSPDEQRLYVADSSQFDWSGGFHHIRMYDVIDGCKTANGQVFAVIEPGQPDGMCVDPAGNLFTSSADSIQVYTPGGDRLGKILVPETCSNVTLGGAQGDRLFITAGHSLYAIDLKAA